MKVRHTLTNQNKNSLTRLKLLQNIAQLYLETLLFQVSYFLLLTLIRRFKKTENISRKFKLGAFVLGSHCFRSMIFKCQRSPLL